MATIFRLDYLGALHHVFVRGNDKRDIFLDDSDRSFFVKRLADLKQETGLKLYAWCLMTNHFHLLIETGTEMLQTVMNRLLSVYATRFHKRNGSVGHLFQGPYGAKLCARDAYFLRLVRYIHRNPVQAGICIDPSDWKWSGHGQLLSGAPGLLDETLPLSFFGQDSTDARRAYGAFCSDSSDDHETCFTPEVPRIAPAIELTAIADEVAGEFKVRAADLLAGSRKHSWTQIKLELLRRAELNGHSQKAVADLLGMSSAALCQLKSRQKLKS